MNRRDFCVRALSGVLLWSGLDLAGEAQEPTVQLRLHPESPEGRGGRAGSCFQGDPLFVSVEGVADPEGLSVHWDGQHYPVLARSGARLGAIVPVRVDLKTGVQPVTLLGGDGKQLARSSVLVHSQWFPMQRLTISATTLASYDDPRNKSDDVKILDSLRDSDPVQRWHGSFHMPLNAPKTTSFGQKRIYNGWKTGWHKGTDLGAYEGQSIHAPGAGKVVHVARGLVNGNTVVLSHGLGLGTVYLHMQRTSVKLGQQVAQGQQIGLVGGTGGFAPHLHWEARLHTVPIDPESLTRLPADWR